MPCLSCGRTFHDECEIGCEKCHGEQDKLIQHFKTYNGQNRAGQPIKDPDKVTDPYSTGRKRAATMYPLFRTNPCEWRGKKNCGGGKNPIIGCFKGLQQDRHHGPIKNPLRNEPGNVHRICKPCHARWHTLNDADYDEATNETLLHAPEPAEELELLTNEMERNLKK